MSATGSPTIFTVILTLVPVIALTVSAIAAPSVEIGFFWVSIMMALTVSLYAWRQGDRIGQATMLLVYCLLACSIILAVTSVFDLTNVSLLGKLMDAESGVLIGGLLSFSLLTVISARLSRRFPASLAWGALVACLMAASYSLTYISELSSDYSVIFTVTSLVGCLAAFIALCCSKENLSDNHYLGVLSLIVIFICMSNPGTEENLATGLITSLIFLFAGTLFFSVRRNVPVVVRIAGVMLIYIGSTSFIQDLLLNVLNVNEIAAGIPAFFCSGLVAAWLRFHKDQIPRGLYWVSMFTFGYLGIYSIIPESFTDPLLTTTIGTIALFVLVCIWFAPSHLPSMELTWRVRIRYAFAAAGFVIAMAVTGTWFKLSIDMLTEN